MARKPRIAHLSGPAATIQNSPPLVTSNKARAKHGLPPIRDSAGAPSRFDALRPQRLAAPVTIYIEQYSAHPLEADAAELYGPPDGFLGPDGSFHTERQGEFDKPVYQVELLPDDGVYPLPYMSRQADGSPWDEECVFRSAPSKLARQSFYPDGSRSFEDIDRLQVGPKGTGNLISEKAEVDFFRVLPPAGYTKGLSRDRRTDAGDGDISRETRGVDFFSYKPYHLATSPSRRDLARAANAVQKIMSTGNYDGAIWTEGSPTIEETIYWLNLVVDTQLPVCGNAAQRPMGQVSADGAKNIIDSIDYISSRVWSDENGCDRAGMVMIQDQRIFAARSVQKGDARPGGYVATGGHGGILGAAGHDGFPLLHYIPTARHTYRSDVNIARLPKETHGVRLGETKIEEMAVRIKADDGTLLEKAIPRVSVVKDGSYVDEDNSDPKREVDLIALIEDNLQHAPLAGFVVEGLAPYGLMTSTARTQVMSRALYSGFPVARVGRGNAEGFVPVRPGAIAGSNLTATKARILLMACLMKFGCLPPAANPENPTPDEVTAVQKKLALYQAVFDVH